MFPSTFFSLLCVDHGAFWLPVIVLGMRKVLQC